MGIPLVHLAVACSFFSQLCPIHWCHGSVCNMVPLCGLGVSWGRSVGCSVCFFPFVVPGGSGGSYFDDSACVCSFVANVASSSIHHASTAAQFELQ